MPFCGYVPVGVSDSDEALRADADDMLEYTDGAKSTSEQAESLTAREGRWIFRHSAQEPVIGSGKD